MRDTLTQEQWERRCEAALREIAPTVRISVAMALLNDAGCAPVLWPQLDYVFEKEGLASWGDVLAWLQATREAPIRRSLIRRRQIGPITVAWVLRLRALLLKIAPVVPPPDWRAIADKLAGTVRLLDSFVCDEDTLRALAAALAEYEEAKEDRADVEDAQRRLADGQAPVPYAEMRALLFSDTEPNEALKRAAARYRATHADHNPTSE